jgi:hypothetical protein
MDITPEQNAQTTPEEIVRRATAEVFAEPKDKRNRIRRTLAQTPAVVEAVAQIVIGRTDCLGELLKLGDEVMYRSLLKSWQLTSAEQKSRIIAELHQSTSEQYRRLTSALAIGLLPNHFDDAVALIERVNPIIPLPEFARSDFATNARELLRRLQNSDLAEFRQRKLLTLVITSLRGKNPAQLTLAIDVINRLRTSKIDPTSFHSNGRKEWLTFLEELGPNERSEVAAALFDVDERCRSVFWDTTKFGPITARDTVPAPPPPRLEEPRAPSPDFEGPRDQPVNRDRYPAEVASRREADSPAATISTTAENRLSSEEDSMRWLGNMHLHIGALVNRLQLGTAAAAKAAQLESALAERTSELKRMSVANDLAQRRIAQVENEREAARDSEGRISASSAELMQRIKALEGDTERREHRVAELTDIRADLTQRVQALQTENEQKRLRLERLSGETASLEQRVIESEEGRLLYGEQKVKEVKRALAERIGRELEDLPELTRDSGAETSELLRVRFRRLIALLRENEILDQSRAIRRR